MIVENVTLVGLEFSVCFFFKSGLILLTIIVYQFIAAVHMKDTVGLQAHVCEE